MKNQIKVTINPSFNVLLGLLFIGLKLSNIINWSWLWVLSPLWIPFVLLLAFALIMGLVVLFLKK
jgi:hypothetical protein